ncbi:hypothetical protein BJY01DRAFT_254072 [Aspergillus pseudoustus]|uniref:t-SNARE coiled-coil homology domain-containing protein n=1 Tax=Aspergillus pseudoustus TaxID=1810923 RepID=A0ABR4IW07_9EURO
MSVNPTLAHIPQQAICPEEHSPARLVVPGCHEATLETVRRISSDLAKVQERRRKLSAYAHRSFFDNDSRKIENVQSLNQEIRALFDSIRELLKLSPAPGVETQWNLQHRNFCDEVKRCFETNLKLTACGKETDRVKYSSWINNNDNTDMRDENPAEASMENSGQFQVRIEKRLSQVYDNAQQVASQRATIPREVIERSTGIARMEQDLGIIYDMMKYLSIISRQQEPMIRHVYNNAGTAANETEKASTELSGAVANARNARRWKWYALITLVLVIAIIAIVGGVVGNR